MQTEKLMIFDTTLRDGEQAPGASMSVKEKLEVAMQLEALNVDVIEAGFPISSPAQFEAASLISRQLSKATIAALARANEKDINEAAKAISAAKRKRIHVFIATSPIHMQYKLRKSPQEVMKLAVDSVRYASGLVDEIEFSAEDACRSDMDFLIEIVEAAIDAGATIVNIPDTVGYIMPDEYSKIIATLKNKVSNIDKAIISTHCHNDLGMASANTLAGVLSGARQVECTINGIGERAGNTAMEEIVMSIITRPDVYKGIECNIKTTEIARTSRLVSRLCGFAIAPNKAIVGSNAFAHESGIHVHGMLKHRETYEIMTPETIGLKGSKMVLGRHSGRAGFADHCQKLGYQLSDTELQAAFDRFLALADKKKEIFDEDIIAIIDDEVRHYESIYSLEKLLVACGTGTLPTASVKIKNTGETLSAAACGDGPIDAVYQAIRNALGISPKLESYSISAVTSGKDAMGEVVVKVRGEKNKMFMGRSVSTDIIEASAKAYIDAINKVVAAEN